RLGMPRLEMLLRLSEALRIDDLANLTGDPSSRIDRFSRGEHPSVAPVRAVLQRYAVTGPAGHRYPVTVLRDRVAAAWRAWHQSLERRDEVGAVLPDLLADVEASASAADTDRRATHAILADVYHLTQHMLVNAADPALLWLVVDRAMGAAQVADQPLALAGGAWTVGLMLRGDGRMDEALDLVRDGAALLEPALADGDDETRAMWGALQLHGAVTCARAGRDGDAWAWWDRAAAVARTLRTGYEHP